MKLPESMPDLLEKVVEPLSPSSDSDSWYSRLPMKLAVALPLGVVLGGYFGLRLTRADPTVGLLVGLGLMLFTWGIGVVVTVFDHFETKKRRVNKRPPVDFG